MRPGRNQAGMNSYLCEIFAAVYTKLGWNAWCLVSRWNDIFCVINVLLTQMHPGLKFLNLVWHFLSFTWDRYELRLAREFLVLVQQPRRNQSTSLTDFIVRLVSGTHKRRNIWRPIQTNASPSLSQSCKYPHIIQGLLPYAQVDFSIQSSVKVCAIKKPPIAHG